MVFPRSSTSQSPWGSGSDFCFAACFGVVVFGWCAFLGMTFFRGGFRFWGSGFLWVLFLWFCVFFLGILPRGNYTDSMLFLQMFPDLKLKN